MSCTDQKQILALFSLILEKGPPKNKEKFRHIGDQIYEIKTRRGVRILCFFPRFNDRSLILTHGFYKTHNKILKNEKKKTEEWRRKYLKSANSKNNYNILEE